MAVHLTIKGSNPSWPAVYCGATGSIQITDNPPQMTCPKCLAAHMTERLNALRNEQRPLGLFAIFYDGETRPVAGFVLEQDAEAYARKYSGGAEWKIRHVQVVADED